MPCPTVHQKHANATLAADSCPAKATKLSGKMEAMGDVRYVRCIGTIRRASVHTVNGKESYWPPLMTLTDN